MQAPRFLGSIMLSRIKIRGLFIPELIKFLRPEKKFNSLSDLKKQIEFDTKEARKFHKKASLWN